MKSKSSIYNKSGSPLTICIGLFLFRILHKQATGIHYQQPLTIKMKRTGKLIWRMVPLIQQIHTFLLSAIPDQVSLSPQPKLQMEQTKVLTKTTPVIKKSLIITLF